MQLTCHQYLTNEADTFHGQSGKREEKNSRRLWNVNLTTKQQSEFMMHSSENLSSRKERIGKNSTLNLNGFFRSFHGNINFFQPFSIRINFLWDAIFNLHEHKARKGEEFNFPPWNSLLPLVLSGKIHFYFHSSFSTLSKVMKFEVPLCHPSQNHSNVFQLPSDNFFFTQI
jgi:hypothetical protein